MDCGYYISGNVFRGGRPNKFQIGAKGKWWWVGQGIRALALRVRKKKNSIIR